MPKAKGKNVHLSKAEWLSKALSSLTRSGGEKPRIDDIVAAVGVSRGSFYWHFKDRADFVKELVEFWHQESTLSVLERLDTLDAIPEEKLKILMEMVCVNQLTNHDQAVRNWALGDQRVEKQLRKTEKLRLDHVKSLFVDCGFAEEDAEFRATIFVSEASREGLLFSRMSLKERKKRAQMFYDLLMTRVET